MVRLLMIGGKERPLDFTFRGLWEYENRTGRNSIEDFSALETGAVSPSVTMMVNFVLAGLIAGARVEKLPIDFDEYDVAGWLSDDPSVFVKSMGIFKDSWPTANADPDGKKTKRAAK